MNPFLSFIRRPVTIALIIIIAAGFSIYFFFIRKPEIPPDVFEVNRGIIIQEVSVTGKIRASEEIDLAFEYGGKVSAVNAKVGDSVFAGQILASLDSSELIAQLSDAEANIKVQEAALDNLKKGVKPEEINYYETKLASAEISFENARKNLVDKIKDAYTKSEDGVRAKIDQLFNNPRGLAPSLVFSSPFRADMEAERALIEFILNSWQISLHKLEATGDLEIYLDSAGKNLEQIKSFLEKAALAVGDLTTGSSLSQTTIDTYRSAVSTARTNTNTAISNLRTAEEGWRNAGAAVVLAEKELTFKKTGATPEEISGQEALLAQAGAKAQLYRAKIYKNSLRSPISGIIVKQDTKAGEIVSANSAVISLISFGKYEIETNIPEADIAKINVGNPASVTLDAFGGDVIFDARVVEIEPGETVIENVATYKTVLHIVNEDERIKPGMTANIDIEAAKKENVLIIPRRAVTSKNGGKIVMLMTGEKIIEERKIQTGLTDSNGNIEIIEGLKEGDKVIIPAK